MRHKRWFLLVAVLLITLFAGIAITRTTRFQKWYQPPTFYLPADDEVAEIRASLKESEVSWPGISEFKVPADHVPGILDQLRPAKYNSEPWELGRINVELGEIVIRTKSGEEIRLHFYDAGVNPVLFTSDGVDQFFGKVESYKLKNGEHEFDKGVPGGLKLSNLVRRATEAAKKQAN
jgi:hypothetical protein